MSDLTDPYRKKLLYRAMHRGFKEADIVIGTFARENLALMSEEEVEEFQVLLEISDQELYSWIVGRAPVPAAHDGPVMARLKAFPVAETLERERQQG